MARMIPRAPRDGDQSRTAVLPSACRVIGAQLAAARDVRQLSIEAAASKLLLSRGQVLGLEQADTTPFYNTTFFLRGLRKYMAFMDIPQDLLVDDEEEHEEEGALRLFLADVGPARGRSAFDSSRNWLLGAAATSLLVIPATGAYLGRTVWAWWHERDDTVTLTAASPLPARPHERTREDFTGLLSE